MNKSSRRGIETRIWDCTYEICSWCIAYEEVGIASCTVFHPTSRWDSWSGSGNWEVPAWQAEFGLPTRGFCLLATRTGPGIQYGMIVFHSPFHEFGHSSVVTWCHYILTVAKIACELFQWRGWINCSLLKALSCPSIGPNWQSSLWNAAVSTLVPIRVPFADCVHQNFLLWHCVHWPDCRLSIEIMHLSTCQPVDVTLHNPLTSW